MNQTNVAYEQLLERFVTWAKDQPDIRAAIVLGSRARVDRPADEWSDLDLVMVVADPQRYLNNTDWLQNIGHSLITFVEPTATGGEMERRVLFEGGLDVDFSIIPRLKVEEMIQHGIPSDVGEGFRRGMHVLLDRDGLATQMELPPMDGVPSKLPTQSAFDEAINDFWYHAVWVAKKLRRGELWTAKLCCDGYMKRLLLKAMEWHAQALHGADYDTWHNGRFLEKWTESQTLDELRSAFAHYDVIDVQRALVVTMELFRRLTGEIAESLDYVYPTLADESASEMVGRLLPETTQIEDTTCTPIEDSRYDIIVKGHLAKRWSAGLSNLAITHEQPGYTRLSGVLSDQAALHGVLNQIRDLGLPLMSVHHAHMETA